MVDISPVQLVSQDDEDENIFSKFPCFADTCSDIIILLNDILIWHRIFISMFLTLLMENSFFISGCWSTVNKYW